MDIVEEIQQPYLYAWGRNKDGELSIGNQKKSNIPKPVQGLKNFQIQSVSSGSNHSALITTDGQLFICGSALHGKLGFEDANQTYYPKFLLVQAMKDYIVTQVATGDYHTMCLLENGQVYAWGGTLHKKLGQGAGKPCRVENLAQIQSIGCGDFHSAALSSNGDLYTWGGGGRDYNRGQLGLGHLLDQDTPQIIRDRVIKFSCGGYHMMALDQDGELWSWGSGMYGETGQGEFQNQLVPKKVKILFNQKQIIVDDLYLKNKQDSMIQDFKLGGHHTLLLTSKGYVYSCGYAQHGQLGIRINENQNKFQLIVGLAGKPIIQIAAGWNHSIVLSSNSDVYICGHNQAGQLGVGDDESHTSFVRVNQLQSKRIKTIFAGGNHSWAMIDYNQPKIDNYQPPSPLKEDYKIEQFQQPIEHINDLDIQITEVKMFHRFIKLTVPQQFEFSVKAKINDYLNSIQKDPNTKLTKYQNDEESSGIKDGLSFTIMMVSDLSQYKVTLEELEDPKQTQIGHQFTVKRQNFKKYPIYDWILQAEKIINIPGVQFKYLELRPQ